jgi:hypothetical protein
MIKKSKKSNILLVDDDGLYSRALIMNLNIEVDIEASSCISPITAKELVQKNRYDLVVSDIIFQHGIKQRDVEEFLQLCNDLGVPIIISSNGEWDHLPILADLKIVQKCQPFDQKLQILIDTAREGKKQARLPKEFIHRIANPDRHIETPIEKWGRRLMERKGPRSELVEYSDFLELQTINQRLKKSSEDGDWSKRELNELIDRHLEVLNRMKRGKSYQGKSTNPRYKMASVGVK